MKSPQSQLDLTLWRPTTRVPSFLRSPVGREATFSLLEFMFIRVFGLPWIDIDGFRYGGCKSVTWGSRIYRWKQATAVLSRTFSVVHLVVPLLSDSVAAEMGMGDRMG